MMSITEIQLYNALKKKLGEEESSLLVEFVKAEVRSELDSKTNVFLIKEDKLDIINLIKEDKVDLIKWMVALWISAVGIIISAVKFL
jgi:hypothetical protein